MSRLLVVLACLLGVLGAAWAQERAVGGGLGCWCSDNKQWGWSLHYLRNAPDYYMQVDWGYRNLTPVKPVGIVRGEFGVPVKQWETGMLGIGPALTWYWAPTDSLNLDGWLRAVSDDDYHENYLESLAEAALAIAIFSTLDAATSPLTTMNDRGHGLKIRPAMTLQQSIGGSGQLRLSHDFGHGYHDPFSGTSLTLEFVKRF